MIPVNCTPHAIVIRTENGDVTIEPAPSEVRVVVTQGAMTAPVGTPECPIPAAGPDTFGEIVVFDRKTGEKRPFSASDVPPEGIVVSLVASNAIAARAAHEIGRAPLSAVLDRVFRPDTGPSAIRNEKNQIIAVCRLIRAG